jgi:aryl-alcohol dehydrogenase
MASPEGGPFRIAEVDLDAPRDDEILVRLAAVGLCHTDVFAQQGGYRFGIPAVLGHEGAGVVEAIGEKVTKVRPGDRVAITFRSCGVCLPCDSGHPAHCNDFRPLNFSGKRKDGSTSLHNGGEELVSNFFGQSSFASHALTYERNVVPIDADIPFEIAATLCCSVQTGVGAVLNVLRAGRESSLMITGCGPVGLSAVMGAALAGCAVIIAVEPHRQRRRLALDFGATHAIDPAETADLPGAVRAILPQGVNYALDTTGQPDVLESIMRALAPQGTLGLLGIAERGAHLPGEQNLVLSAGHCVRGIYLGDSDPDTFLPLLMDHYRNSQLPIDRMIRTYPFANINEAVAEQHAGSATKAVLTFG